MRAHCAPLLGLPRHADADAYWDRRSEHTERELARLFLSDAKVSDWLVDTGFASGVADLDAMARRCRSAAVHEIVRLESVAEEAVKAAGDYATAFEQHPARAGGDGVATKSILAYRGGFDGDLSEPAATEVAEAAARWRDSRRPPAAPTGCCCGSGCIRRCAWASRCSFTSGSATATAICTIRIRCICWTSCARAGDTPIMLLHCYPYEREAGYLAQAFNNVYLDGGLSINYLGARSAAFIGRLLEMAPFRKILYSSDGFGPAELHCLGARLWRNGIRDVLQEFVDADEWSEARRDPGRRPDRTRDNARASTGWPDYRTPRINSARPGAGVDAVAPGHRSADHGRVVALGALDQPAAAGGQVVDHLRQFEGQCIHVDDIDIGLLADLDDPTIGEAEKRCGVEGLLANDVFERELRPAVAVAGPVGQQECRVGGIADQPAVGATVGQSRNGRGVRQHLVDRIVVARGVVVERQHQQRRGIGFEHQVVHGGQRVLAAAFGDGSDSPLGRRFVVGRVADGVDAVGAVLDQSVHAVEQRKRMRRKVVFGQDRRAHGRVGQAARQLARDPVPPSACGRWSK